MPALAFGYLTDSVSHVPPLYDTFIPPARDLTYADPVFGTVVRRVSAALSSPNNADGGTLTWVMDEYSTMSAFNQGHSQFILQHDSYYGLYDGQGNYLRDLPFEIYASAEPRWSRSSPYLLYYINGNALKSYNTSSGAISLLRTFAEYGKVSGKGESDISLDGNHFALAGDDRYVFVYEISTNSKGPVLDTVGHGFDSIYITPSNNVTITWYQPGTGRYTGIELFDRNMVFQRQLTRAGGHMDVTRDTNGDEVLIWTNAADPAPICNNAIVKVRLSDAKQTCLATLDWSLAVHITAPDGNGTAIVSTYDPTNPSASQWHPFTNEVFQVMLNGSGVRRFAHHRSRPLNGYNYTARACVSRDGQRVLYSSNYDLQVLQGAPPEYSDAYLFTIPGSIVLKSLTTGLGVGSIPTAFSFEGGTSPIDLNASATRSFGTKVASRDLDGGGSGEVVTTPAPGTVPDPRVRAFDRDGLAVSSGDRQSRLVAWIVRDALGRGSSV